MIDILMEDSAMTLDSATIDELVRSYVLCEADLESKDIFEFAYHEIKMQKKHLCVTVIPTRVCNLRCSYCIQNNLFDMKEHLEMSKETIDDMVLWINKHVEIWQTEDVKVIFYGGEPLMTKPDVLEYLINQMSEKVNTKVWFEMVTNGTLIKKHKLLMGKIEEYRVTIDGPKSLHDSRRGYENGRGTYDSIIENLKWVIENGSKITIRINVDQRNRTILKEIVDQVLKDLNVSKMKFVLHPVQPYVEGMSMENLHANLRETGAAMGECAEYIRDIGCEVDMWRIDCGVSTMSLWVFDTDGKIYKCLEHIGIEDKAVTETQKNSLNAEFYKILSRKFDDECTKCPYIGLCLGGCYRQWEIDGKKQCYRELFSEYMPHILEAQYGGICD